MKNNITFFPTRLAWQCKSFMRKSGWPGLVAAAGFLLCGLFGLFAFLPIQEQVKSLEKEATALHPLPDVTLARDPSLNPADQLTQFYQFFPKQNVVTEPMAKLYNAAIQQNINLEQGEYRLLPARDGKLARYDIVLPVRGGYVQIRKFIAQALIDVPNLSLDAIAFGRQKIDDAAIDAQLTMTLYLRQD